MKLRRALAAAAMTAATAPIALLSTSAAFATDDVSPSPSATESTLEATPSETASGPAAGQTSPAPAESSPAAEESSPATGESSPAPTGSTPSGEESEDEEGGDEVVKECPVDEDGDPIRDVSESLHSSLKGLPETVVAGSGWTNFTFEVSNSGDRTIEDILPHIDAVARDAELEHDYSDLVTVQVRAGDRWVDLVTQLGEGGTVNWFDLEGGQSISWDLRVSISHYVPRGIGIGIGLAQYTDDEACWTAEDENYGLYYFEILPAGTDAGEPDDAKPQTGGKSEITEVHQVDADGELAETGSDSNLPVIATIGGIAVLAGTGVVFTMKRRARAEA